jgi:hypothetical protein
MLARSLGQEEANVTTQRKKPKPVEIDTFTIYKFDGQDRRLRDVIEPGPPVEIPLQGKHGEGKVARRGWGSSAFLGVSRVGSGWRAYIRVSGKLSHLGTYADEESAAIAYNRAVKRLPLREQAFSRLNDVVDDGRVLVRRPHGKKGWTHCKNGHPYTEANIWRDRHGCRNCRPATVTALDGPGDGNEERERDSAAGAHGRGPRPGASHHREGHHARPCEPEGQSEARGREAGASAGTMGARWHIAHDTCGCGAWVQVNVYPRANSLAVGGPAVAQQCD